MPGPLPLVLLLGPPPGAGARRVGRATGGSAKVEEDGDQHGEVAGPLPPGFPAAPGTRPADADHPFSPGTPASGLLQKRLPRLQVSRCGTLRTGRPAPGPTGALALRRAAAAALFRDQGASPGQRGAASPLARLPGYSGVAPLGTDPGRP